MLAEHRGDLPPAVDPAQLDLPAGHEAKEQDQCRVLGRQRALRLHAAPEFLVDPLDRIRGSQRLPLGAWEPEEREQFVTAFPQARYDARTPLAPRALEGRVCGAGGVGIRRVDDAMGVVANLGQGMLRRFTREIAQFVDAAALDGSPRPG